MNIKIVLKSEIMVNIVINVLIDYILLQKS